MQQPEEYLARAAGPTQPALLLMQGVAGVAVQKAALRLVIGFMVGGLGSKHEVGRNADLRRVS